MSHSTTTTNVNEPGPVVDENQLISSINAKCPGAHGVLASYYCDIVGEGKGFLSVVTRVKLNWDSQSTGRELLPSSVVIKTPTLEKLKSFGKMSEGFTEAKLISFHNKECQMYEFLNLHSAPPIPLAKLVLAKHGSPEDYGMLMLEDLTDVAVSRKFELSHFSNDYRLEQVMALTDAIARLQAYGLKHNAEQFLGVEDIEHPFQYLIDDLQPNLEKTREEFGQDALKYPTEYYIKLMKEAHTRLPTYRNPQSFGFTPVLTLGDVQPNNIMWVRSSENNDLPSHVLMAMLDFQIVHIGCCMSDVTSIVCLGLSTDARRRHQDAVLDRYLAVLAENTNGNSPITRCEALKARQLLMLQFSVLGLARMSMFKQFNRMGKMSEARLNELLLKFNNLVDECKNCVL